MPRRERKIVKMPIVEKKATRKKYTVPIKLPIPVAENPPIPARFQKPNVLPKTKKEIERKVKIPDPFIIILQNIIDDSGMNAIEISVKAAEMGRAITWKTVNNLIVGKTSRPQHYSCESIIIACGCEYLIRKKEMVSEQIA